MKKLFSCMIVMLCCIAVARAGMVVPKLGIALPGSHKAEAFGASSTKDTGMGISLGMEYLVPGSDRFMYGAGFEYLLSRELENNGGSFKFAPVYATGMYFLKANDNKFWPFVKLNLGYNIMYDGNDDYKGPLSLKGGFHYGFGLGAIIQEYIHLDILYSNYAGTAEWLGSSLDVNYSDIGLKVGYAFSTN